MGPATAVILLAGGIVFLLYGQTAGKMILSLNCALLGAWLGGMAGKQAGAVIPGMLIGGFLGGVVSVPMAGHAIRLLAGLVGFMFGACVWRTLPLEPSYTWAGGMMGFIFLSMLSFITPKWTMIVSTGLQGSTMLVLGLLGLAYQYQSIAATMNGVLSNQFVLPVAVIVPAICGWLYQNATTPAAVAVKK